jgi:hypothetical protein
LAKRKKLAGSKVQLVQEKMSHFVCFTHTSKGSPSSFTIWNLSQKVTDPFPKRFTPTKQSFWARRLFELLAEEDELDLVIDGQDTSTSDTTEDVSTSTLEERLDTLTGNDLAEGVEGRAVLDGLTRGHHHTTTDGVKRVRSNTSTSGNTPAEHERDEERALKSTSKDNRLERVVHSEVQTTVDNDTKNGGTETTVETDDTIGGEGLLVDVNETVELALTTALGGLGVVGKTGTGVVERVDEEEGSGTSHLGVISGCIKGKKS